MRTTNASGRVTRRRGTQDGQSLTVAIIVLFLLLFLGGLFIALVINNLRNAGEAVKRTAADKFADAGINYLNEQLTRSPQGADWRPIPDDLPGDQNPAPDPDDPRNDIDPNDPDYFFLKEVNPGRDGYDTAGNPLDFGPYTRHAFGGPTPGAGTQGGRALVRITYRPFPVNVPLPPDASPERRYLRLDSVGRVGTIDPKDPTTFAKSEALGLRREVLAYKAIGLTDYVRFFTNKDNRPITATLGSINQVLDSPAAASGSARPETAPVPRDIIASYIGSIRANMGLNFYGVNYLTLNADRNDALEVSGPITFNGVNPTTAAVSATDRTRVYINANGGVPNLLPSLSPAFDTLNGLVRDNPAGADTQTLPSPTSRNLRNTGRLEPPVIDEPIGANGTTRYRALTRDSEPLDAAHMTSAEATALNGLSEDVPGRIGWGAGMYVNNADDVQRESESLIGAYSLRSDWLNPGMSPYWRGDFKYEPPAATLIFHPRYVEIRRSPTSTGRSYFRDPSGRRLAANATVVRFSGPSDTAPSVGLPNNGLTYKYKGYPTERVTVNGLTVNRGEFVIFAEGNINVRGTIGGRDPETGELYERHVTIVSNESIYINGNLLRDNLRGDDPAVQAIQGRSSVALLARNHVVVNTTQFLSPDEGLVKAEEPGSDTRALFLSSAPGNNVLGLRLNPGSIDATNRQPWPVTGANPGYSPMLFLRHSAETISGTAIRLGVNDTGGVPNLLGFTIGGRSLGPGGTTLLVGGPLENVGAYMNDVVDLNVNQLFPTHASPVSVASGVGIDNLLQLFYDASAGLDNQSDYRLTRVGVAPLDIRIEALMYAQERSFFIIPGPWFNPDPNDTYERYVLPDPTRPGSTARMARSGDSAGARRVDPRFPFYGQPMDIRITVFGAVSENVPAEIGDQGAWLEKWGWIPHYYGSTGLSSAPGYLGQGTALTTVHGQFSTMPALSGPRNEGVGLVFEYDARWEAPGDTRLDAYGRTLPLAPRLPVAPGLLFVGEDPQNK